MRASTFASPLVALSLVAAHALAVGCSATHTLTDEDAGPAHGDTGVIELVDGGDGGDGSLDAGFDAGAPLDSQVGPLVDAPSFLDAFVDPIDAFVGIDGASPIDAFVSSDAFSPVDAFRRTDAFVPPDAPVTRPDAGPPGVVCGTSVCASPQVCCIQRRGREQTRTCTAADACSGGVAAECDGPEDCGSGEVCCGARRPGSIGAAECTAESMCRVGRVCHVDVDCQSGQRCCDIMGVGVCSNFCF